MKGFKGFFGSVFGTSGKGQAPSPGRGSPPAPSPARNPAAEALAGVPYKKGDLIGPSWSSACYEVHGVLGRGGFGVVYLVNRTNVSGPLCALKTFRDEYLADAGARELFRREAQVWVDLDRHPYLVEAKYVNEFAGRLYIELEYIAPDEQGLNSLEGYLERRPPDLVQALRWAIQLCHGMEYAYSRSIRCHRDIKPANILISQDKTVKISDFGLAVAAEGACRGRGEAVVREEGRGGFGLSVVQTGGRRVCGTPGYIAPEVYRGEGADVRSDIYSFGLVLWQMGKRTTTLPFQAVYRGNVEEYLRGVYEEQMSGRLPPLDGPLGPVVERCLAADPEGRYQGFAQLREALELLLEREFGEMFQLVQPPEERDAVREAVKWTLKGISLKNAALYEEAIARLDKALETDPENETAWCEKGAILDKLGRYEEAIRCYDEVLAINPHKRDAWTAKVLDLLLLDRHDKAVACSEQAVMDPWVVGVRSWLEDVPEIVASLRRVEAGLVRNPKLLYDNEYRANIRWLSKYSRRLSDLVDKFGGCENE